MRSPKNSIGQSLRPEVVDLESRRLLSGVTVSYAGVDGSDMVGPTAAVGPDGVPDLHIIVSGVPTSGASSNRVASPVQSLKISDPADSNFTWVFGNNAQLGPNVVYQVRPVGPNDTTETVDIYINPTVVSADQTRSVTLPAGSTLNMALAYAVNNVTSTFTTSTIKPTNLGRPAPASSPASATVVTNSPYTATLGSQDATYGTSHLTVSNLPAGVNFQSIEISDVAGNTWYLGNPGNSVFNVYPTRLSSTSFDLGFNSVRPEGGSTMLVRFQLQNDPNYYVVPFVAPSSQTNPNLRDPQTSVISGQAPIQVYPSTQVDKVTYVDAKGSHTVDIQTLLDMATPGSSPRYTNFVFNDGVTGGIYTFDKTLQVNSGLVLKAADPKVTFLFNFAANRTYDGAIKIHSSHVTLQGFQVRFTGPTHLGFTFGSDTYQSAIIDGFELNQASRVDINLIGLNLQAVIDPLAPTAPGNPEPNAMLDIAMGYYTSGTIVGNTLLGGGMSLRFGPWSILNNTYVGALAGTVCMGVFNINNPIDVDIEGNTVVTSMPGYTTGGDVYGLFSANYGGYNITLKNNDVKVGIVPPGTTGDVPNHPEVILTEGYSYLFEGNTAALKFSADRTLIGVPTATLGVLPGSGSVITILNGPNAGQWFTIAQTFQSSDSSTLYLILEGMAALPSGSYDIAISYGYRDYNIVGNTLDVSGTSSTALVLTSGLFGVTVSDNTFIGDGTGINSNGWQYSQAIRARVSYTSGSGPFDGWSYNPMAGVVITDNIIKDAIGGIRVAIDDAFTKTTLGRSYAFLTIDDNHFIYSTVYRDAQGNVLAPLVVGTGGYYGSIANNVVSLATGALGFSDPRDLDLTIQGNTIQWVGVAAPAYSIQVVSAMVNGSIVLNQNSAIPVNTSSLVVDLSGQYNQVGITSPNGTVAGQFGPNGTSYSSSSLPGQVDVGQSTFLLGPANAKDEVAAKGQTIALPSGQYAGLAFLAASSNGVQTVTFVVNYSDGSRDLVTLSISDWISGYSGAGTTGPGETIAATGLLNTASGSNQVLGNTNAYLYAYTLPINSNKTVVSVTLPANDKVKVLAMNMVDTATMSTPSGTVQTQLAGNVVGTTSDSNTRAGNGSPLPGLDGAGNTYSADLLGSSLTWGSSTFAITGPGSYNVVQSAVQPVSIPLAQGRYSSIQFLGGAVNGAQTGTFLVTYTDGTTAAVTIKLSDWASGGGAPGEAVVEQMAYRNTPNGKSSGLSFYVYGYSIALDPNKTVASLTLPSNNGNIFILAVDQVALPATSVQSYGPGQVPLTGNAVGTTTDANTLAGNGSAFSGLDGAGNTYSADLLGSSITWGSSTFAITGPGSYNVVQSAAQPVSIPLTQGRYSSIQFLGGAVNGAQTGTFLVTYTDGTTAAVTIKLSDWASGGGAPGEAVVEQMAYRNTPNGKSSGLSFYVYGYSIALDPNKTVASLTLPSNNGNIFILAVDVVGQVTTTPAATPTVLKSSAMMMSAATSTRTTNSTISAMAIAGTSTPAVETFATPAVVTTAATPAVTPTAPGTISAEAVTAPQQKVEIMGRRHPQGVKFPHLRPALGAGHKLPPRAVGRFPGLHRGGKA